MVTSVLAQSHNLNYDIYQVGEEICPAERLEQALNLMEDRSLMSRSEYQEDDDMLLFIERLERAILLGEPVYVITSDAPVGRNHVAMWLNFRTSSRLYRFVNGETTWVIRNSGSISTFIDHAVARTFANAESGGWREISNRTMMPNSEVVLHFAPPATVFWTTLSVRENGLQFPERLFGQPF